MEKKKLYDFTKVPVEREIDVFTDIDISKAVGNTIHQNTADIGMDDIARAIYHKGKVELSKIEADAVNTMVQRSNLLISVKTAVSKLFSNK
ncbi:MAG: hypothetical protein J5965_05655 [Aeriscardovia sp.]|nr:hypothetical protein [Aeriscardovia sp.]MBQ2674147.1 hypothetical protein [Prevotella sp.]